MKKALQKKIHHWNKLVEELAEAKQVEMAMRKAIIAELFSEATVGTHTIELGAGFELKAVIKESTTIDQGSLEAMMAKFSRRNKKESLDNVIIFKPSLSMKGYKELSIPARNIVDEALVTKPSAPALSVVAPKEEK